MNKKQLDILMSPAFVAGLCLLLLNDFFLKYLFGNWLTGKLSDFTGLFIFPLFCAALLPQRKKIIFAATTILFVVWKSPWSQPFIDYWNSFAGWPLGRTVDPSDLIALLVLPLSYWYMNQPHASVRNPIALYVTAAVAVFAFSATSYSKRTRYEFGNTYYFQMSRTSLLRKMYQLDRTIQDYEISTCSRAVPERSFLKLQLPSMLCGGPIDAEISIVGDQTRSAVTVTQMELQCADREDEKQKVQEVFENEFVAKINHLNVDLAVKRTEDEFSADDPALKNLEIYLVPFSKRAELHVATLTGYFKTRFGLKILTLPIVSPDGILPCDDISRDTRCPNAENLLTLMEKAYPRVAKNTRALMIGLVDDMIVRSAARIRTCAYRSTERTAVISLDSLDPITYCEPPDDDLLETRLRTALENEITILARMLRETNPAQSAYLNFNGCAYILNEN